MTDQPPTIYHLYGDDRLAMEEFIRSLKEKLGPEANAAMNVQHFDGSRFDFSTFEESCLSIPFLTQRRIVVLDHIEKLPKDKNWLEGFYSLLNDLPLSTALVMTEHRERTSSKRKPSVHPIARWVSEHPEVSYSRNCSIPQGDDFIRWIQARCSDLGGAISTDAARLLASWVIEDPLQADQETRKLIAYVDSSREISVEDVQNLTPFQSQTDIFALVDAIGERNGGQAQRLLVRLLEDEDPGYAFAMIVRQFRLLLIAREAIDRGQPIGDSLSLPAFVLRKLEAQTRSFSDIELRQIYSRLLEIDLGSKTGTIDLEVGLDTLIATVARER